MKKMNRSYVAIWQAHYLAVSPERFLHPKKRKSFVLLCPPEMSFLQIQQNVVLQREQFIMLQPLFFSIGTAHFGQFAMSMNAAYFLYCFSEFFPKHPPSCHSFPHFQQTSCEHSHTALFLHRPGLMTAFPHPSFGHHFNLLFEPIITSLLTASNFFTSSLLQNCRT